MKRESSKSVRTPTPFRPRLHQLRELLYILFVALLLSAGMKALDLFGSNSQHRLFLWVGMAVAGLLWMGWVASGISTRVRQNRAFRVLDLLLFNTLLLLLLLEGLLAIVAHFSPNPLVWDESRVSGPLDSNRQPFQSIFGFSANSQGFHDEEFFSGDEENLVVVLLGDSFAYSVVPFSRTFATLAERKLQASLDRKFQGIAVHNMGVPAIGPPQYAYLLANEVPPLNPQLIVLAIFVGNDILESRIHRSYRPLNLETWRTGTAVWRAYRWLHASQEIQNLTEIHSQRPGQEVLPDYLDNPALERATFPEDTFWEIERQRLEITLLDEPHVHEDYAAFFSWMDRIRALAGEKLAVMLIPDEFQVNDDLWQRVLSDTKTPQAYQRDLPQLRISEYLQLHGIPTLDLLPRLRASSIRPYHLRDTHLNGTGNRIAGEALGEFLLQLLESQKGNLP